MKKGNRNEEMGEIKRRNWGRGMRRWKKGEKKGN